MIYYYRARAFVYPPFVRPYILRARSPRSARQRVAADAVHIIVIVIINIIRSVLLRVYAVRSDGRGRIKYYFAPSGRCATPPLWHNRTALPVTFNDRANTADPGA